MKAALPIYFASLVAKVLSPWLPHESRSLAVRFFPREKEDSDLGFVKIDFLIYPGRIIELSRKYFQKKSPLNRGLLTFERKIFTFR